MNIIERAQQNMSLALYADADQTVVSKPWPAHSLDIPEDQYVLRMCVKTPETGLLVPPDLEWLLASIVTCAAQQHRMGIPLSFVYVTVRSGVVRSVADDVWHADGFSMRTARHPEQNYVWANGMPTEHLVQNFDIPEDFDPLVHNIHQFFQDRADPTKVRTLPTESLNLIDPYIVHRRPLVREGTIRTFFRISFVPIAIEDDRNTQNPLLPIAPWNRSDIRDTLIRYEEK